MSGKYMVSRLKDLIEERQISQIHIYRFHDSKLHQQSRQWQFGHEFLEVDGWPYNLNRVVTFRVTGYILELYF